eukprot:1206527-Rhodomonas_salina.4
MKTAETLSQPLFGCYAPSGFRWASPRHWQRVSLWGYCSAATGCCEPHCDSGHWQSTRAAGSSSPSARSRHGSSLQPPT